MFEDMNRSKITLKGELQDFEADTITVIKKSEEDSLSLAEFKEVVEKFCANNSGNEVNISIVLEAVK